MARDKIIILTILFLYPSLSSFAASSDYCQEYGLGYHFYCQDEQKEESENSSQSSAKIESQDDYREKLKEMQNQLEDKKVKAVIYPTEDNVKDYMAYQSKVLDKASFFADQWRRVLWKTPELDYTLKRPVSKIGKEVWIDERNKNTVNIVKNINQRYGIFFVFRSDCLYCHKYAPILKSFRDKYDLSIIPISLDGGGIPYFDKYLTNKGQLERLNIEIKSVPATLLFDQQTRKIIPIGFGVLSHSDLEERIYATTKLEVGDDF